MEQRNGSNRNGGGLQIWLLAVVMVGVSSYSAFEQKPVVWSLNHDDPPIIVHDGSLHFQLHADGESNAFDQWTVPTHGDANLLTTTGYSPAVPTELTSGWQIEVCNEKPCAHGIQIVTDAGQTQYTITLISSNDDIDTTQVNWGTPHAQDDHVFRNSSYMPKYLFIGTTEYDCPNPADCKIELGPQY